MRKGPAVVVAMVVAAFALSVATRPSAGGRASGAAGPVPTATASPLPGLPVRLPGRVRVIPEAKGFVAVDELDAGRLAVPTGRLAVTDYFMGDPQVELGVPSGTHRLRITRAKLLTGGRGPGSVALVTLETAPGPPVRWKRAGSVVTDGGMAGMASGEAADATSDDPALSERDVDALNRSGANQVGEVRLGDGLNRFSFATGLGDGAYAVYEGLDDRGTVSRVVLDGGLLHLDWADAAAR